MTTETLAREIAPTRNGGGVKHFSAMLLCDYYKISHRAQYPKGTEHVYSTWTSRGSRREGVTHVVAFSMQAFVQRYFIDYFNDYFFSRAKAEVVEEYARIIRNTLGVAEPDVSHIEALWELGYLPLEVKAVPEGTLVPLRVPMLTIVNTKPEFFWLTNYVETLFSNENWQAMTSATTAFAYRKLLSRFAKETGGDPTAVPFQGHDFSMRGMSSVEAAAASGAGHLLSFTGTDTVPAIIYLEQYYGANVETELVGASIPATEHSVMCAYMEPRIVDGVEEIDEIKTFEHLITEVYPAGFVSIVSDTFDLWKTLGEYLPKLKEKIMARDGRVVIRPDSGDPVKIITGDVGFEEGSLAYKGVVECLWDIFGGTVNEQGYKILDPHIGAIYGDSISLERAEAILENLKTKGFASTNIVFGIGSYSYQMVTRDTFEFALKSTSVTINGVEKAIYKDPVTDTNHMKRSLKGRIKVVAEDGDLKVIDGLNAESDYEDDQMRVIFRDGVVFNFQTLGEIRDRLLGKVEA